MDDEQWQKNTVLIFVLNSELLFSVMRAATVYARGNHWQIIVIVIVKIYVRWDLEIYIHGHTSES